MKFIWLSAILLLFSVSARAEPPKIAQCFQVRTMELSDSETSRYYVDATSHCQREYDAVYVRVAFLDAAGRELARSLWAIYWVRSGRREEHEFAFPRAAAGFRSIRLLGVTETLAEADSPAQQPEPATVAAAPSSPPTETAAQQPPATGAAKPAEPARANRPEPVKAEPAKVEKSVSIDEPAAGQKYLQLVATSKRNADIMVDVLNQKRFKAMAAEIPERRGTFRVLVGPLADAAVNQMRADLQDAGFPGNAAIKRTF